MAIPAGGAVLQGRRHRAVHPRRRVATAFAGVFVTMLALVPFAAIRVWGGPACCATWPGPCCCSAPRPPRSTWCRSCGWTATTCSATPSISPTCAPTPTGSGVGCCAVVVARSPVTAAGNG
ncbi:hypothetical protein NKG94_05790 [Micromonospora sp. M12]